MGRPYSRAPSLLRCRGLLCVSVLVVVALVGGMPVSVVNVVQMVAVQDGGVTASLAVNVRVLLGRLVHR